MTNLNRRLALAALALALPACIHAQFTQQWRTSFDGGMNISDRASGVVTDADGNVFLAGTINSSGNDAFSDIALYKFDSAGTLQWRKTYDGPAHSQDTCFEVALAGDGSVVVVGRTLTPTTGSDMVTLKYRATDGALMWERLYDGPAHSVDEAIDVVADAAGNVYVTGEVWNDAEFFSNGDFCTVKYDAAGTLQWATLFDGPATFIAYSDQPVHIALDPDGNLVVAGDSPDASNGTDIMAVKYDGATGAQLWATRYDPGGNDTGLQIAPNGDVLLAGNTYQSGDKVVLLRLAGATGDLIWEHVDVFPHDGKLVRPNSMAIDAQGNPVISLTYDPDFDNSNLNYNIQTTKYSFATGDRIWSTSVGTSVFYDGQDAEAVSVDAEGNVMVVGSNLFLPKNRFTAWYFRGTDGALTFTSDYPFPSDSDHPIKVTFDSAGNAIAVGITSNNNTSFSDMFAIKFLRDGGLRGVSGSVQLEGYLPTLEGMQVLIELRAPGGSQVLESQVVTLNSFGSFSYVSSLPEGNYDVSAKASHWLRQKLPNQTLTASGLAGTAFSLRNGDVNGDNVVSISDFNALRQAFGSAPGGTHWNPRADLNGDGVVSIGDFNILRSAFGSSGD